LTTSSARTLWATIALIVASFVLTRLLFWIFPNVFEPWNAQTVDKFFVVRSSSAALRPAYDSTVVHIDISDRTFERLENAYLNRSQYARVARNLAEMKTALQIWDFIFPAKTNREEDSTFVAAVADAKNVYFGLGFSVSKEPEGKPAGMQSKRTDQYLDATRWSIKVEGNAEELPRVHRAKITFPDLAGASRGLGFLNIDFDRDGVYRRVPLLFRYDDGYYPSFAFRAACDYLGVTPDRVILAPGHHITLKDARRPGGKPHDTVIPIDASATMLVNYIGPLRRADSTASMLHFDFADVLNASDDRTELEMWADILQGKIAVVSEVATGASDVGPIPTDNQFPLSGVHASVLNTILTENFLDEANWTEMLLVELVVLLLVLFLALKLSPRNFSISSIEVVLGYFVLALAVFLYAGIVVNVLRPVIEIAFASFAVVAYRYVGEQKAKEVLRRSFEAYFPPTVVRRLMGNPSLITTGGQKKELTILFSDIKSFTTHSATLTPDEIQKLLNEYFEAMVEILFKHEGTVDKFIGDGLMVFFGDPEPQSDHALRCVRAAIEMQRKCRELKTRWVREGRFPLMVRIGINTGPVVVGNMGSARRLSYTALGANVNLAQRLESNAPVEGILISARTQELVQDSVKTRRLEPIMVKGLDVPIQVYEVQLEEYLIWHGHSSRIRL
jgi:adenylate cyclase